MPKSIRKICLHIIFSTKNRAPFMRSDEIRDELFSYCHGILESRNTFPIIVGGYIDHIHILCHYPQHELINNTIKELKRSSSIWIKSKGFYYKDFHWQSGYGVFSVSESMKNTVFEYIENQEQHHKKMSFQDEFRALLKHHNIEIDEKYLWD